MITKHLKHLINHCNEQYPHFESERGQADIQAAIKENEKIDTKRRELSQAIESIVSLSGRASAGHDTECECSLCLIRRKAFEVWAA